MPSTPEERMLSLSLPHEEPTFERELTSLLNRYTLENDSNTPDYILAIYLTQCLGAYNSAVQARQQWSAGGVLDGTTPAG